MSNEDVYKKIFAKNLNHYMWLNEKQQIDLINDLGFNRSAVSTWCNGTRLPRMSVIEKLAEYFNIEKSDLIEDKSDKPKEPYYLNAESRRIAQEVYDNPNLKILFDAARDVEPDDLLLVIEMVKKLKK